MRTDREENKRRSLELWLLLPLTFLFIFLNWTLFRFNDVENALPLSYALFFFGLVNLNVFIFLGIIFFLGRNLVKLYADSKPKIFGKTLKARLFLAFVSFAFIPTVLMFLVSVFYINNSFDRWFSNQTQKVLEDSTRLTSQYISDTKSDLFYRANRIVEGLDSDKTKQKDIDSAVKRMGLDSVEYYRLSQKNYLSSVYSEKSGFYLPRIEWDEIQKIEEENKNQSLIRKSEQGEWLSVIVHFEEKEGFVVVSKVLPFTLTETIDSVMDLRKEFQKTKAFRIPLKSTYLFILITMTLVILAFGGWFSLYLAQSMSKSLYALGAATKRISRGDFNLIKFRTGMLEVNELIVNFNRMADELKRTQENLNKSMGELEQRSIYMNTVLSQVSSGVLSIDQKFNITYYNKRAEQIFRISEELGRKSAPSEILPKEIIDLVRQFNGLEDELLIQELDIELEKGSTLPLQVSVAVLKGAQSQKAGYILTVEKVDLLRENQRVKAWKEVATRVAHEIKNPLTPVQLSAERLRKKFSDKVQDPVFNDLIKNILTHVDLIKNLVNEFNQFARFPQMNPEKVNINNFVTELISSYQSSHPEIDFYFHLDKDIHTLIFDSEKIRRVFINLIENAIEALQGCENKKVHIDINLSQSERTVYLYFCDSGRGMSDDQKSQIFKTSFTTKREQGGLGLSIVKKIIEDHNGRISFVENYKNYSTVFLIELPYIKI